MDRRLFCTKCIPGIIRFVFLLLLITVICAQICTGFNVDLRHPLIYSSLQPGSTFGYSVALVKNGGSRILLVGAPTGNSSHDTRLTYEPGVVYGCAIGSASLCNEVPLQVKKETIIRGRFYYEELRDKGWLGVSIDVSPDDSQFVACGHLWKDQQFKKDVYLANGVCYVVSTNLSLSSIKKLLPLVRGSKQLIDTQYIYALGLSGFSAHYSRDEKTLLLGAPGAYRFSGTVVAVNDYPKLLSTDLINPDTLYRVPIPNEQRNDDTYFGSGVTSGKFFENKVVYYIAGAPRQGPNGKVFIFLYPEDQDGEVDIKHVREGVQMGEYFGSSVCALDFNGDGFDDLVVGSPLYSSEIEEGRVSVYMSDKSGIRAQPDYLTGSSALKARFGTTVVGIGDINLDGYNDLAVGAPYEGNGAVYIYHGSISGITKKYAQRIAASDVDIQLKGFGISISKSKDIDDNFYPDLAVGASESDHAVILKSKPIIRIFGNVSFSVNHINTEIQNCTTNGTLATCFQVTICSLYNGKHASNSLKIETIVRVDEHFERIAIFDGTQLASNYNYTDSFQISRPSCRTLDLFVKKNVQDVLTPVRLTATHLPVVEAHEIKNFCPTCPVIDVNFSGEVTKSLKFFTGCGEDDQCISDLQLEAKFRSSDSGNVYVLGTDEELNLLISVVNKGEPAFQASLRLSFPSNVDFTRIPSECSFSSVGNLTCSLGNPLNSSGIVSLNIPLDLKRVTNADPLVFDIEVTTASEELPTTLGDNRLSLNLPISSVTGVSFSGWTVFEEQFVFNRSNPGYVPVIHMYQISKTKPSPIDELNLEFKFPISTRSLSTTSPNSIVQQLSILVSNNYIPVPSELCTTAVENPSSPLQILNHEESEHGSAAVIDCASMGCHVLRCTIGPIVKRDSVTVNISAIVDLKTIIENVGKEEKIIILRSFGSITGPGIDSKSSVRTIFVPQDLVPQSQGIAWWIILVAVLAGILLLGLLIFALYKFGFFQRNRPDPLLEESELNESRDEDESSP